MRELVQWTGKSKVDLTVEERNLLSVAYKNVIGARSAHTDRHTHTYTQQFNFPLCVPISRASWRTLNADERKDDKLVIEYKKQVHSLHCAHTRTHTHTHMVVWWRV